MILFDKVSFSYQEDQPPVLDNISLLIKKGSFVTLIGHNGSGKSTLAKLMNALLLPQSGVVNILGYDSREEDHLWEIRQRVGMIFQNPDNQIVASIVEEDVAFGPENLGVLPSEIRSRVDRALIDVSMSDYAKRPPHMLSGGQKQRIAIAGVLAMEPEIVVFDEATSMLDPRGRKEMMEIMHELHEKGITVVNITHFMEEVLHARYAYVLEKGRIVMEGEPHEIFRQKDRLKALHLDIPEIVEISSALQQAGLPIEEVVEPEDLVRQLCQLK